MCTGHRLYLEKQRRRCAEDELPRATQNTKRAAVIPSGRPASSATREPREDTVDRGSPCLRNTIAVKDALCFLLYSYRGKIRLRMDLPNSDGSLWFTFTVYGNFHIVTSRCILL